VRTAAKGATGEAVMAPSERAQRWREGARQGSAEDQYCLAYCYSDGAEGLAENKWMTEALFRKAAAQGHARAQTNLGAMYYFGDGVEKNLELASSFCRQSAERADPSGQYRLGIMYEQGEGVLERNLELAVSWYRQAAEQGHLQAKCDLGRRLLGGDGVEKDVEAAVTWFREAADAGHTDAQADLACCYAHGEGVTQNDALAVQWWAKAVKGKAVKGGHVFARYNLGMGYMHGKYGLPKNVELAKAFMKSAANRGCAEAKEALQVLGRCAMELEPGQCASCGAPDITRTCLGCRKVRYCTLACQDRDWTSHKPDCGGLKTCLCFSCTDE
jgi:hypothetical protein